MEWWKPEPGKIEETVGNKERRSREIGQTSVIKNGDEGGLEQSITGPV